MIYVILILGRILLNNNWFIKFYFDLCMRDKLLVRFVDSSWDGFCDRRELLYVYGFIFYCFKCVIKNMFECDYWIISSFNYECVI